MNKTPLHPIVKQGLEQFKTIMQAEKHNVKYPLAIIRAGRQFGFFCKNNNNKENTPCKQ